MMIFSRLGRASAFGAVLLLVTVVAMVRFSPLRSMTLGALAPAAATSSPPFVHVRESDKQPPAPATTVTLRSCPSPQVNHYGGANAWGLLCGPLQELADGTHVTMECWVSTYPASSAPQDRSAKWFKVTVTDGPSVGREGWIWADLIADQTPDIPKCDHIGHENETYTPQPIAPLRLTIVGKCTTEGGTLTGVSTDFTPGGTYEVSATRPDGSTYPLAQNAHPVGADGSITWTWPCVGDPAGTYTTNLVDLSTGSTTGDVRFTIDPTGDPRKAKAPAREPTTEPTTRKTPSPRPEHSSHKPFTRPTTDPPQAPTTWPETVGGDAQTWTDWTNAGGRQGLTISKGSTVRISCRLRGFEVADHNLWWYRIASSPWDDHYYVSADAFYNNGKTEGLLKGTPWVDERVAVC